LPLLVRAVTRSSPSDKQQNRCG